MIKQDILKLEHILEQNIQRFLDGGGTLISNSFGNGNDKCCAITATTRTESRLPELSRLLGAEVMHDEMFAITNGFDATPYQKVREAYGRGDYNDEVIDDEALYDLWQVGKNLREKYLVRK